MLKDFNDLAVCVSVCVSAMWVMHMLSADAAMHIATLSVG